MNHFKRIVNCLVATAVAALLTGCVVRQTVTSGGEVIKDDYVVKRPLKDALKGAQ